MLRTITIITLCVLSPFSSMAHGQVPQYTTSFRARDIASNGTTLHVRVGGSGEGRGLVAFPGTRARRASVAIA